MTVTNKGTKPEALGYPTGFDTRGALTSPHPGYYNRQQVIFQDGRIDPIGGYSHYERGARLEILHCNMKVNKLRIKTCNCVIIT